MIIGLVGRSRVGKDTAAAFLAAEQGYIIKRLAQPVKDACKVLYGWSDVEVESGAKEMVDKTWNVTPRFAMIHLTQTMRECMGSDFFTRRFFDSWDGESVVIPDVRFDVDVQEIHKRGGMTIKIVREGGPDHVFEFTIDSLQTHHVIHNNGTIDDLKRSVLQCTKPVETA